LYALAMPSPDDTLKMLAARYPAAAGLTALVQRRFPVKPKPAPVPSGPDIRIGLVLPLLLPPGLAEDFKPNQAMAEFCAGATLAAADARQAGIPLVLSFYDTHRNADTLSKIIRQRDLETMHAILGPIYSKEVGPLATFAAKKHIPVINPLVYATGTDTTITWFYQTEPSYADVARAMQALRPRGAGRRVCILYGTTLKDSLLAMAFAASTLQQGGVVALQKKVAKNSAANLPKFITEAGLDSTSILFVPNAESLVKAQLLSALEITHCQALTVTYASWVEESDIALDRFERLGIRFIYQESPAFGNVLADRVGQGIQAQCGLPVTEIGLKAYDLVYSLGTVLAQAKPEARGSFLRDYSPIRSLFWAGYDFTLGQANARVPIYHIEAGALVAE